MPEHDETATRRGWSGAGAGGAEDLQRQARDKKEDVKQQARAKADDLKHEARERASEVKDQANERVGRRASEIAARVDSFADALRSAAETLRARDEGWLAQNADEAAEQANRMRGYLDRNDLNGMVEDLEDFGRRNRGLFAGGAFAAGMALGRFLRASPPEPGTAEPGTATRAEGVSTQAGPGAREMDVSGEGGAGHSLYGGASSLPRTEGEV